MGAIWQHKLVSAVQMGKDLRTWLWLPCVDGVRKDDKGGLIAYLKDVVIWGLQCEGLSLVPVGNDWLCRDEDGLWWVLTHESYMSLDEEKHVTLFPNKQTQRQAIAIMAMQKMQREFDAMSPREQKALCEKYPDMFTKVEVEV